MTAAWGQACLQVLKGVSLTSTFPSYAVSSGGSAMRDEALQNGTLHAIATLVRKVLLRGVRLGLLEVNGSTATSARLARNEVADEIATPGRRARTDRTRRKPRRKVHMKAAAAAAAPAEDCDYDRDHIRSCPPVVPPAVAGALVSLIDACCGPAPMRAGDAGRQRAAYAAGLADPCRGLLRVRRASDLALTALCGLALDFDLWGNDLRAAAPVFTAVASRYGRAFLEDRGDVFDGEDYGCLLRKQINLQYLLDSVRVRLDRSVASASLTPASTKGGLSSLPWMPPTPFASSLALKSIASSLSDLVYTMLLSTLTSSAAPCVVRGERDIGALVTTLTECPFGSLAAHVVTTSLARLAIRCGTLSPQALSWRDDEGWTAAVGPRGWEPEDVALEARLGRNLLLCHYHDIVAPLLLSRSAPQRPPPPHHEAKGSDGDSTADMEGALQPMEAVASDGDTMEHTFLPLDWTHHWRLSFLTFVVRFPSSRARFSFLPSISLFYTQYCQKFQWLSSLAGTDERQSISTSTGHLLLLAGKSRSLDGTILGLGHSNNKKKTAGHMLAVLSQFLVLNSSKEKDSR